MRKYIGYFLLGTVFLASSCKKTELELKPFNQVDESLIFNQEADFQLAVNGMYNGLRTAGTYFVSGTWNIIADAMADNLILNQAGRGTLTNFSQWRYTGNATYGLFANGYSITRRANAILENLEKLPNGTFKNNAKAEALGIRALVYFDMSRVYSKTYQNASATDFTVPYVTSTDTKITPGNEPVKAFYDKVVADLVEASSLINTSNGTGRLNKAAIEGLLSRVYLYMGDYAKCIASSNIALGTTPVLPSIADFPKVWTDETNNGVLFKVMNTVLDGNNSQGVNYSQVVSGGIRSEYVVDYDFKQLFTSTDVRTNAYIQTSAFNGVNQNHVVKHRARPGGVNGVLDAKVLRTAEVLLNRAEAYYRSGNVVSALADLNLLKSNRYTGFTPIVGLTGAPLLSEILLERRLELAFEGDRFWDLKRLNMPVVRGNKGDRADGTGTPHLFFTLAVTDHRFQLPLPQSELNFNDKLKQNPGY